MALHKAKLKSNCFVYWHYTIKEDKILHKIVK